MIIEEGRDLKENDFPTLYRYESSSFASHNLSLYLCEFHITKETPKGWWISNDGYGWDKPKWVAKEGIKRFAYPTKELALESFLKRKAKMIQKLKRNLVCTKIIYNIAEKVQKGELQEDHAKVNPYTKDIYWDLWSEAWK